MRRGLEHCAAAARSRCNTMTANGCTEGSRFGSGVVDPWRGGRGESSPASRGRGRARREGRRKAQPVFAADEGQRAGGDHVTPGDTAGRGAGPSAHQCVRAGERRRRHAASSRKFCFRKSFFVLPFLLGAQTRTHGDDQATAKAYDCANALILR